MPVNTKLGDIEENAILTKWSAILGRHPAQLNSIHEADAELLPLPNTQEGKTLAATIDTVCEEIALGFYQEPETIGWVAAMASLSDLAAVGATPLGILVSATLAKVEQQEGIAKGLEAACRTLKTFVLGGDTNFADQTSISVCALGLVSENKKLTRKGATVGDIVYSTGLFGDGAALAAKSIYHLPDALYKESDYRPVARINEGETIADFATACMDSSDGLLTTLDQLARINAVGVEITAPIENLLSPAARKISKALNIPAFPFISTMHGEFELVFTVPAVKNEEFILHATACGLYPIPIGKVTASTGVFIGSQQVNTTRLRNLFAEVNGNMQNYLAEILKYSLD